MSERKMRPRIEQMHFGPELFEYIQKLLDGIDEIENLDNITSNINELNSIISGIKDALSEMTNKLQSLDFVPRLTIIEDTITFTKDINVFLDIPSRAIELKTVYFENLTNLDEIELILSENNNFSTIDYHSLIKPKVYDIANIPIIDKNNEENFKLKLKFTNRTSTNQEITVKYKIKLTNFSLREEE